jgi:NAD(P)H-nitrite reductase large subunit
MQSKRYVIVGGSAAGMAAAEVIRGHDPHGSIQVLSQEADAPYFRPLIPLLVSGKGRRDEIYLQGRGPYRTQSIDLRLNTRVVRVDPEAQQVYTVNGAAIGYDRLLIASGSRPETPPDTQGLNVEGVMSLRTLEEATRMADRSRQSRQVVVLGAGLLGLKAAMALGQRGVAVTLVEKEAEILPRLMESDAGARIRRALQDAGMTIITDATVKTVQANARGLCGVVLDSGRALACQLMCISIGVQPATAYLDGSGIRIERGVVTDSHTACSAPNVYAAGDVAVTFDTVTGHPVVTGLWTNAVEMGRCAGANMTGHATVYGGTLGICAATQVAGLPFVSMGIVHTSGTDYETHTQSTSNGYRKLIFTPRGDRLVGALFIGDIANTGLYLTIIRERTKLSAFKNQVLAHRLHYGHLLDSRYITPARLRSGKI